MQRIYKLKAKDSVINVVPSCMGNVSKDISADNIKKTGLYRYFYNFSVDYDSIDTDFILDIHKYLMIKNNTK